MSKQICELLILIDPRYFNISQYFNTNQGNRRIFFGQKPQQLKSAEQF